MYSPYFFFSAAATTEIYPLSLHDALPISSAAEAPAGGGEQWPMLRPFVEFVRSLLPDEGPGYDNDGYIVGSERRGLLDDRSEERRVGKECRYRRAQNKEEKK